MRQLNLMVDQLANSSTSSNFCWRLDQIMLFDFLLINFLFRVLINFSVVDQNYDESWSRNWWVDQLFDQPSKFDQLIIILLINSSTVNFDLMSCRKSNKKKNKIKQNKLKYLQQAPHVPLPSTWHDYTSWIQLNI